MAVNILSFCWNTESIRLCETLSSDKKSENRNTLSSSWSSMLTGGYTTGWYDCDIPDFMTALTDKITTMNPDVFVVGFQEDAYPGSYFHSHLLPGENGGDGIMTSLGYTLLGRSKMMGVGVTTWKAAQSGDIKERGLRTSVYVKNGTNAIFEGSREYVCSDIITKGKGATAIYLKFPTFRLAILNSHLPFNAKSLVSAKTSEDPMIRKNAIFPSNICYNNIIKNLVRDHSAPIDFTIFMGDLNYRIDTSVGAHSVANELLNDYDNPSNNVLRKYLQYDELRREMNAGNIYKYREGINDEGPMFMPTCKMVKHRNMACNFSMGAVPADGSDCYNTGKHDQRTPSWCDRILFENTSSNGQILCNYYDRFDAGETMLKSDHAGVIANFHVR